MPRNALGIYTLPASNPVVPFTVIESTWANSTMSDVALALTQSISSGGLTPAVANLPMGGFKHTGVGAATLPNQYARADQVQQGSLISIIGATVDVNRLAYTGGLIFGSGGTIPLVNQQIVSFTPPATNAGPPTLSLSGGPAYPIRNPDGSGLAANRLIQNQPVAMIWNSNSSTWSLISYSGAVISTLTSADPQMITVTQPSQGNLILTPIVNVGGGTVKLGPTGKVPAELIPVDNASLQGMWDASANTLPPNGTFSGQYYVIVVPGNLMLYVASGSGSWVLQSTAVSSGDNIIWNQTSPEPTGWYKISKSAVVTAQNTVNIATPSFSAVNLQNWINAADSPTGFVLANGSRQMGDVNAASLTTRNNGWVSQNLKLVGGNWLFDGSSQFGWVRTNSSAFGAVDWISTAASAAAGSTATLLDIAYWGINGAYVKVPWGIGVTPRPTYQFDISVNGTVRTMVQSLDNQVSLRTSVTNAGVFQDVARYDANAAIVTASGVPLTYNLQDVSGAMFQAMSMKVNKQIQIGNGTDGSICSTQKSLGAVNGPVDLTQRQTTVVNASSTITAITMAPGQIARLFVAGNGSITLPATVRLPRGGVAYGVACTIISLYFDGTNIWSTFTPFDGSFP